MSDANVTRTGQINGTGATDALWLEIFAGEVLTAFERAAKLRGSIRTRSVQGVRSVMFPAIYRAGIRNHVPGTEILGKIIKNNEVEISLDDMAISDVTVAQIDELKTAWDVRAPYAAALGEAQALYYDRVISNSVVASARNTNELFAGDGHGVVVTDQPDIGASADFTASGADLIAGFNLGKQKLEEQAVPVESLKAVLKPAPWYLIANSDKALNQFYNGNTGNSVARQVLRTVSDIEITKSIAPLFGFNVTQYNASTNATGIVQSVDGDPTPGTNLPAAANLPFGEGMPFAYPTKYQGDQSKTVGILYIDAAAGMLELLGVTMETAWDVRRQVTLMLAKQALGADKLRAKCAVELRRH